MKDADEDVLLRGARVRDLFAVRKHLQLLALVIENEDVVVLIGGHDKTSEHELGEHDLHVRLIMGDVSRFWIIEVSLGVQRHVDKLSDLIVHLEPLSFDA